MSGKGDDNLTINTAGNNSISAGVGQDIIELGSDATGINTIKVDASADIVDVNDTKTVVIVTNFNKDNDVIKIDGLPAGEYGTNYIDGNESVVDMSAALTLANNTLTGDLKYIRVTVNNDSYLAFDINSDHSVDGAVYLKDTNITADNIK